MTALWIGLGILAVLAAAVLIVAYICFRMAFYTDRKEPQEEFAIPEGEIYEPYRDKMLHWMKETRALPHEDVEVRSFDGLLLRGKYYEYSPDSPVELMFHGYRGRADRDLCGGVQRCFKLGRSALIVDQRACGQSEGHVITFGVNERRDCHTWLDFMLKRFGTERKIILCGISMGAATVMMAAGDPLPKSVVGILADCGYTSARDIIKSVIRQMGLPPTLSYPFVRLGARLYGHFSLEERSPMESLARCKLPVILFHGETDDFVPCDMSRKNFEVCTAPKKLVTVPGAGHGLSYVLDPQGYLQALRDFFGPILTGE